MIEFYIRKEFIMADNFNIIKCPACQKEMTKIFVPSAGVNVDVCLDGCGGIYFDNREFKCFDEQHENIAEITEAIKNKTFIKVDETLPRSCPVCGARMAKNYSSIKRQVQIDECYSCGGKFLDHGELERIRSEYKTEGERSADTMKELYNTVGVELKALAEENAKLWANRSLLKKLFDSLVFG